MDNRLVIGRHEAILSLEGTKQYCHCKELGNLTSNVLTPSTDCRVPRNDANHTKKNPHIAVRVTIYNKSCF
jgi:hypothetical protein